MSTEEEMFNYFTDYLVSKRKNIKSNEFVKRNLSIFLSFIEGEKMITLAKQHSVSNGRIHDILLDVSYLLIRLYEDNIFKLKRDVKYGNTKYLKYFLIEYQPHKRKSKTNAFYNIKNFLEKNLKWL